MGRAAYASATTLLITADSGGSNGARVRLWKWELQKFARRTGLSITVCHFPPGTSKWNKIEHRLFSYIAMNWRGKPLASLAAIVSLIGSTTTTAGLRVRSEIDKNTYPQGVAPTDQQVAQINIERHPFHGDWNYTIHPEPAPSNESVIL
jgi:DDE family transposase